MKEPLLVTYRGGKLAGSVQLPSSKSESNRVLVIQALTQGTCELHNLSEANDTVLMQRLLQSPAAHLNVEDAGTVMRFLTAFFAITNQAKTLSGTPRMHQRPIGLLVEALRELGADIDYVATEGFPPLRINGIDLSWPVTTLAVPSQISSQFISALLLIAPVLPTGLTLQLTGPVFSRPYLELTLQLMTHFGARTTWTTQQEIQVQASPYRPAAYTVTADWSAASYWYSLVAVAEEAELFLPGLSENSAQGDRVLAELMRAFGVATEFTPAGALLSKTAPGPMPGLFDFQNCPDLAPALIVTAAAKNLKISCTGLQSLRLKETDRIVALQQELPRFGYELLETTPGIFKVTASQRQATAQEGVVPVTTYSDHRMAMALVPFAFSRPLAFAEPEVVKKSYPRFWDELRKLGFEVEATED